MAKMNEINPSPEATGWLAALLYKLLPGGLGAAVMICVDPPESKRELFARMFVAFACSLVLGEAALDFAHSFSLFSFLDATKRSHTVAVDFIVGGLGWAGIGGIAMLAKRWRADPIKTIEDAKKVIP